MKRADGQESADGSISASAGDFGEFRSGWKLLIAAIVGIGLGLPPVPFHSIGIFAPTLAKEFGWSFASIFGGLALPTAALLILGPFIGLAVDRFGTRRVAVISLVAMSLSYMTLALSTGSLIQYYLTWFAIALTGIGATPISFTRAVSAGFSVRRGLALGIALTGTGLFVLLAKPFAQAMLAHFGWRAAVIGIGLLPLAIGVPAVFWGMPRDTAPSRTPRSNGAVLVPPATGLTVGQSLRTRAFWIMFVVFIPISFAGAAPFPNMENILRSVHVTVGEIVQLTSVIGITIVAGRLLGGWLMDRVWAPLVGTALLAGAACGCLILSQQTVPYAQALLAILLLALAAGVELDLMSYLVARYIGLRSYGVVYGAMYGVFAVGAGIGPSLFGRAFDLAGNYQRIMALCAVLLVISALLLLAMGRYPARDSKPAGVRS